MTIGYFLVERLSSMRLPEKILKKILNRSKMEHWSSGFGKAELIDKIVTATSDLPSDDP